MRHLYASNDSIWAEHTLHKAETNDCFFPCWLHHSCFNIVSQDASVFLNFSKVLPSTSYFYRRESKNIIVFESACLGLFLSGITLTKGS